MYILYIYIYIIALYSMTASYRLIMLTPQVDPHAGDGSASIVTDCSEIAATDAEIHARVLAVSYRNRRIYRLHISITVGL